MKNALTFFLLLLLVTGKNFAQITKRDYIIRNHIREIRVFKTDSSNIGAPYTFHSYDKRGNCILTVDFSTDSGKTDTSIVTWYTYDASDRMLSLVSARKGGIDTISEYFSYRDNTHFTAENIIVRDKATTRIYYEGVIKKHREIRKGYTNGKYVSKISKRLNSPGKDDVLVTRRYRYKSSLSVYHEGKTRFRQRKKHLSRSKGKKYYDASHNLVKTVSRVKSRRDYHDDKWHTQTTVMSYNDRGELVKLQRMETPAYTEYMEYLKW